MRKLALLAVGLVPVVGALVACESNDDSTGGNVAFDGGTFDGSSSGSSGSSSGTSGSSGGTEGGADGGAEGGDAGPFTTFQMAMAGSSTCAVLPDGRLKCWGTPLTVAGMTDAVGDGPGEMGAALPYVALPQRVRKIRSTRSGSGATMCVVLEDGGLRCWGGGPTGTTSQSTFLSDVKTNIALGAGRSAVDVEIGRAHACAILDDGHVKCWGNNAQGALGIGTNVDVVVPPPVVTDLGTGRTAKALAASNGWTCAILDDDRIKCWGAGNNTVSDVGDGGWLCNGGTAHLGDNPGEMGDALPYARLGTDPGTSAPWKAKKVVAGAGFACAILANDRVKCWGQANSGNLGGENETSTGVTILDDAIPFVDVGTDPNTGKPWVVSDITAEDFSVCVTIVKDGGTVRCWGAGEGFGSLGRGDNATIGATPGTMGDALVDVALKPGRKPGPLASNFGAACTLVAEGVANCWGINSNGALGIGLPPSGTTLAIGDDPSELGAGLTETLLQ